LNDLLKEQNDSRVSGDDHYDQIEYFLADKWKKRRKQELDTVKHVHDVMESAGWDQPAKAKNQNQHQGI